MRNALIHYRLDNPLFILVVVCFLVLSYDLGIAQPLPKTIPETVGLSSDRLNRIDELFESYIEDELLAGVVVAVARQGQLAHFRALGGMDLEHSQPMSTNSIFRMASMTKPITSTAVLMLYEEGHFQL